MTDEQPRRRPEWMAYTQGFRQVRLPRTRGRSTDANSVLQVPIRPVHATLAGADQHQPSDAPPLQVVSNATQLPPQTTSVTAACAVPLSGLTPIGPWHQVPLILRCPTCRQLAPT
jgi:hypothetical protein